MQIKKSNPHYPAIFSNSFYKSPYTFYRRKSCGGYLWATSIRRCNSDCPLSSDYYRRVFRSISCAGCLKVGQLFRHTLKIF